MKVKMLAAQYIVDACASQDEAMTLIAKNRPDLILMNLGAPLDEQNTFCGALRNDPETATVAIIAVGLADTSITRFAALDAGADDVLPHPVNDALLLARIRSLLRVRSASQELVLRESTSRALGFEDAKTAFSGAAKVALLTSAAHEQDEISTTLSAGLQSQIDVLSTSGVLKTMGHNAGHDLFVIDATKAHAEQGALFGLVSDLRSRLETRLAAQLVIVPHDKPQVAAMFLDLGADDIATSDSDPSELVLRAKALVTRKKQQDRLRDTVSSGLNAAVTDPLTGLYNRRYVEPHLARLAEQSHKSGRKLAVMMIDIDHFKAINDKYGHAAGDKVLVELSNRLRENLRAIDLVARMGGEEFLVAMPRTCVEDAKLAADRLRKLVNTTAFELGPDHPAINVTVSVGVAVSRRVNADRWASGKICDQADKALYVAKSAGRDQVSMSKSAA